MGAPRGGRAGSTWAIGEIRFGSRGKTNRSTILQDWHTVGSGNHGSDIHLLILRDRPLRGSVLALGYQAVGCSPRSPRLGRKRRLSLRRGPPRTPEPPRSSPASEPGTRWPLPSSPRLVPEAYGADAGNPKTQALRKTLPCV